MMKARLPLDLLPAHDIQLSSARPAGKRRHRYLPRSTQGPGSGWSSSFPRPGVGAVPGHRARAMKNLVGLRPAGLMGSFRPHSTMVRKLQCISPPENLDDGIDRKPGSSNRKECLH
jgi:hypothetical protein